jgi:hypothetical protein
MFNGWKITNILDVGLCELDTADGPYNKTGYRLIWDGNGVVAEYVYKTDDIILPEDAQAFQFPVW